MMIPKAIKDAIMKDVHEDLMTDQVDAGHIAPASGVALRISDVVDLNIELTAVDAPWSADDPLPRAAGAPWMVWIDETDNDAVWPPPTYPLEDYEDPHAGQIYNEYTGEWVWL